jgi:hypothetical protein
MRVSLSGVYLLSTLILSASALSIVVPKCQVTLSSTNYFDASSLSCESCSGTARVQSNATSDVYGNAEGCACAAGYVASTPACDVSSLAGCSVDTCSACAGSTAASANGATCLSCSGTSTFDSSTKKCVCPSPSTASDGTVTYFALTEKNAVGASLGSFQCAACPTRSRVFLSPAGGFAADAGKCVVCDDPHATMSSSGTCVCDSGYTAAGNSALYANGQLGVQCLATAAVSAVTNTYAEATAAVVNYYNVVSYSPTSSSLTTSTSITVNSAVVQHYFLASAVKCKAWSAGSSTSIAACRTLANLCALAMSSPSSSSCQLVAALVKARGTSRSFTGWGPSLPLVAWGYTASIALSDSTMEAEYYYRNAPAKYFTSVEYFLAIYSLNGTFRGVEKLGSHLYLCAKNDLDSPPTWLSFGVGVTKYVTCDLRKMISQGYRLNADGSVSNVLIEPVFYELFMRDTAADAGSSTASSDAGAALAQSLGSIKPVPLPATLVPVPVRVINYRNLLGATPNINERFSNETDDVFTGLFTLFDAASSVAAAGTQPLVVRYASSVVLSVQTMASRPFAVHPPVLTITYSERLTTSIVAGTGNLGFDGATFSAEYYRSEYTNVVLAIRVVGSLGIIAAAVAASTNIISWIRLNARSPIETVITFKHMGLLLVYFIDSYAKIFYWLLIIFTGYFLIFFKLQVCSPLLTVPLELHAP